MKQWSDVLMNPASYYNDVLNTMPDILYVFLFHYETVLISYRLWQMVEEEHWHAAVSNQNDTVY